MNGSMLRLSIPHSHFQGAPRQLSAANGGGGGCSPDDTPGEDGRLDDEQADGCRSDDNGDGGFGGATGSPGDITPNAGNGSAGPDSCPSRGGGGGGGAGRIRVNTVDDAFTIDSNAITSPPVSEGELVIR